MEHSATNLEEIEKEEDQYHSAEEEKEEPKTEDPQPEEPIAKVEADLERAMKLKEEGNTAVREGKYEEAIELY